ncbi:MAG: DUF4339 domain-containing protein, partial [Clostridia bacterium]|nr:DUF4339 domain-containing protein [Clostridia bacterium]
VLKKMVEEGNLKPDSLVWTEGMENWAEAGTVRDLSPLFEASKQVPPIPPLPKQ